MEKEWATFDKPLLKNEEPTPQIALRWKASISRILIEKNENEYHFVRDAKQRFGFSERLVNQLMKFAYERGKKEGFDEGKRKGEKEANDSIRDELSKFLNYDN